MMTEKLRAELIATKKRILHFAWTELSARELILLKADVEYWERATANEMANFDGAVDEVQKPRRFVPPS
jgi:hypothetical protein